MTTKNDAKTTVTLSSGVEVWFNALSNRMAQDLVLYLTKSQLMDDTGEIIDTDNMDGLDQARQLTLINSIMDIVNTILMEPDIVGVKLPRGKAWLRPILRRAYVREQLDPEDLAIVGEDVELQRFLYLRYVAIESDEDFNVILNNTLLLVAEE